MKPRYVALCVLTAVLLGASFTVSRELLAYPMLSGQAIRYTLSALALAALVHGGRRTADRVRVRLTGVELARLFAVAATGLVAFNVLLLFALRRADPAVVGTIVGGSPLILALLGPLQERRRPAPRLVAAAAVLVVGAALVEGGGTADAIGIVLCIGVLFAEAAFSLLAAPLLPRLGPVRLSAWSCALAVPLLLVGALVTREQPRLPTGSEAVALVFLGLFLTVIAFVAWYTGVRGLGVARAGVFVGLVPVASLVTLTLVDGVMPAPLAVAGVVVVAGGLVIGMVGDRHAQTSDDRPPTRARPRRRWPHRHRVAAWHLDRPAPERR